MERRSFNIRHYAAMAATVRLGSVSAAAKEINLTQPAMTQAIARLESDLDCSLFDRGPGGMSPTEPALLLAPRAEAAIAYVGSPRVTGTQIRAFLAVAQAGSYAEASQATGLSSASLHRAISDLSVALGQRLIDRRGRSIELTPQGQKRARSFGLALAELRAGLDDVASWQGKASGRIAIGAMPLSRARWLPAALAGFTKAHPKVDIAVIEGSHTELAGPLRDGEVDIILGALREVGTAEDLSQEAVFEDRPQIILRADHPLTKSDKLQPSQLVEYSWILPGKETPLRHYWEAMMRSCGMEPPHVGVECGSVLTIRELLLASDKITLLSPAQLRVELENGILRAFPCPTEVKRTIGIITRKDWRPTQTQAHLLDMLRASSPEL